MKYTVDRMIRDLQEISRRGGGDAGVAVSIEERTEPGRMEVVTMIDQPDPKDENAGRALLVLAY